MNDVNITFACTLYDRTVSLALGDVQPAGIRLKYVHDVKPRTIFDRMVRGLDYEAAEMSISEFACGLARGDRRFVAIPVFPSRVFRHGFICVNKQANIVVPPDLQGKRIGTPLYTMTASVVIRGLLENEYDVDLSNVRWVEGAVNDPGAHGNPNAPALLKPVLIEKNESGSSLSDLLERGELDAYLGARLPNSLDRGNVTRLFPDYRDRELEYFRRTQVFPIMHVVVIRRDVLEKNPFVADSLYDALCEAKRLAHERMRDTGTIAYMLPWLQSAVEEMSSIFPEGDAWLYGINENRPSLEAILKYLYQQSMTARRLSVDELFER